MTDTTTAPTAAPASSPEPTSSPTPSSTPESTTPSSDTAPEGAEFAGLGTDFDDDTIEVEVPAEPEAEGGTPAEPEPPKPPEPAPAAKPEPAKEATTQPAPSPAPGPKEAAATAAPSSPSEPRTLVEQLDQHRADILGDLANTRFAWDQEEQKKFMADFDVDPSKTIAEYAPKLMSRVYYESVRAALNHINQFVPKLVANFNTAMDQQKAAEAEFFKQFPALSKEKHWADVVQFSDLARRQNPQLSQADLLALVGAAVMAKNKIALGGNGGQPPRRTPNQPFVPARSSSGGPITVKTEQEDPWGGLGEDHGD